MKLVVFTALLSVLLVSSTVYLIMDQGKTELMNLPGKSEHNECLNVFVQTAKWEVYAKNLCSKPKQFTIRFQAAPGGPTITNLTKCLYQYQQELTKSEPDMPLLSYTEEDC